MYDIGVLIFDSLQRSTKRNHWILEKSLGFISYIKLLYMYMGACDQCVSNMRNKS